MATVKPTRRTPEQRAATAAIREHLEISDLGKLMREDLGPPDMLLEGWLQKGALHWFQGSPEDGKSWVALWCVAQLLASDKHAHVLLMDGEMSGRTVAARLRAFDVAPEVAAKRVTHVNLTTVPRDGAEAFVRWAKALRFTLVVFDPMAQHLAGADADEDSNGAVARWIDAMVTPILAAGATVVAVDHIIKNGDTGGYARGASAKKARARVVYEFKKTRDFDRHTTGETTVALAKNSDAAEIPRNRVVELGGDPSTERFVLNVSESRPVERVDRSRDDERRMIDAAVQILTDLPGRNEATQTFLVKQIQGKEDRVKKVLRENANSAGGSLHLRVEERGQRSTLYYSLRGDSGVRIG
jgi:RecA-family ATPase